MFDSVRAELGVIMQPFTGKVVCPTQTKPEIRRITAPPSSKVVEKPSAKYE